MARKMNEFPGIDPKHLEALRAAKIEDTDELMKIWSDKEKRAGLVSSTGVSEEDFLRYAAMARLGRVKGMDLGFLNVLIAAGIDGPKRLFGHTPDTLMKHLGEVVAEKKLTSPVPTLADVTAWFANPRPDVNGKAPDSKHGMPIASAVETN